MQQVSQDQPSQAVADKVDYRRVDGLCKAVEFPGVFRRTCPHAGVAEAMYLKTFCCETLAKQAHIQTVHPDTMDENDGFLRHVFIHTLSAACWYGSIHRRD